MVVEYFDASTEIKGLRRVGLAADNFTAVFAWNAPVHVDDVREKLIKVSGELLRKARVPIDATSTLIYRAMVC